MKILLSLAHGLNVFTITHDDGAVMSIAGFGTVFSQPGPTSPSTQTFDVCNAGPAFTSLFTLNYNECCGALAVLELAVTAPGPVPGAGLPSLVVLVLARALTWARSSPKALVLGGGITPRERIEKGRSRRAPTGNGTRSGPFRIGGRRYSGLGDGP